MTRKNEQERFMSYITERQTHESRMAVADFLRKYADRYHNSDFISSDPVQFPHRYHFKADIEISAFLTAFLSFGAEPPKKKVSSKTAKVPIHVMRKMRRTGMPLLQPPTCCCDNL